MFFNAGAGNAAIFWRLVINARCSRARPQTYLVDPALTDPGDLIDPAARISTPHIIDQLKGLTLQRNIS